MRRSGLMTSYSLDDVLRACLADDGQRRELAQALAIRPREGVAPPSRRIDFSIVRLVIETPDRDVGPQVLKLAETDWRDLLVAAGHAHELDAHEHWAARVVANPPQVTLRDLELPMPVDETGWGRCPHCDRRFKLTSEAWDGARHTRCAGRVRVLSEPNDRP